MKGVIMLVLEEVIPNLVVLFKEDNLIKNNLGKTIVFEKLIPSFEVKRFYFITEVKKGAIRGYHAHKKLHQLLISLSGSITILVDDGKLKKSITLDSPDIALYIGPNIWRTMTWNDDSAALVVLATEIYDEEDYIRDYNEFLSWVNNDNYSF